MTAVEHDYGLAAQQAAEEHLQAIYEYEETPEWGYPEGDHPAVGPWCGCETCVVREVLHAAWPHLKAAALAGVE